MRIGEQRPTARTPVKGSPGDALPGGYGAILDPPKVRWNFHEWRHLRLSFVETQDVGALSIRRSVVGIGLLTPASCLLKFGKSRGAQPMTAQAALTVSCAA